MPIASGSTLTPTSSDPRALSADLQRLLQAYARLLIAGGLAVLTVAMVTDWRWTAQPVTLVGLAVGTAAMRMAPVRLSKYSYLTQTGLPVLVGLVIAPLATVLLAVALGVAASDILWLRKTVIAGLVNTGREVLAVSAAGGYYVASLRLVSIRELSLDFMPAAAVLAGAYFLASRSLFYFSLLVRAKLPLEERLFVLRWEVVGYLVTCLGAGIVIWSLNTLSPAGWVAILLTLGVIGLFARTLIEEAIAAEDLNKVHLMQSVVTGNVSLQTAFEQIEQFAYRLIDWDDLRVYRVEGHEATLAYHGRISGPRGARSPHPAGAALRLASLPHRVSVVPDHGAVVAKLDRIRLELLALTDADADVLVDLDEDVHGISTILPFASPSRTRS